MHITAILSGIWNNAPVWVWPLFFVLLAVGLLAMRTRSSSVIPFYFLPLIGLVSLSAVNKLAHVPGNWLSFALGYLLGMVLAYRWQDRLILGKSGGVVRLAGERVTLVILLTIYFSNFANGVIGAVAPDLRGMLVFTLLLALVLGACSGSLAGRALRVITLKDREDGAGGGGARPVTPTVT